MKNMKKLLRAIVALGFSTVAAVNVIACCSCSNTSNHKGNLASLKAIDASASFKINGNIKTVGASNLKNALAPIILTAVESISQSRVKNNIDYDYQLFTDISGKNPLTTTSDLTKNIDIFVKITATEHTIILKPGSSTKVIKFTLPAVNNIAGITSIDPPVAGAFVVYSATRSVAKSDIVKALTSDIVKKIRAINTSVADLSNMQLVVAEKPHGSDVKVVNFSEAKSVYVTITASNSNFLTGTTEPIKVDMPAATANLSGITSANQFGTLVAANFKVNYLNKVKKADIIVAIKKNGQLKESLSDLNENVTNITTDTTLKIAETLGGEDMGTTQTVNLATSSFNVYITITPGKDSTLFAGSSRANIEVTLPKLS